MKKTKKKSDNFLFKKEQIQYLRDLLSKHDNGETGFKNNVTLFLIEAEQACITFEKLKTTKDVALHRRKLSNIKNNMRQTMEDLKDILSKDAKFQLIPQQHLKVTVGQPEAFKKFIEDTNIFSDAFDSLKKAELLICEAEAKLEKQKPEKGRQLSDPQGLIHEIVLSYSRHITEPKMYRNSSLFSVVSYILEIMSLPHEYPERAIKRAIREIPS